MGRSAPRPQEQHGLARAAEQGSAVVDFVLVGGLLTMFSFDLVNKSYEDGLSFRGISLHTFKGGH